MSPKQKRILVISVSTVVLALTVTVVLLCIALSKAKNIPVPEPETKIVYLPLTEPEKDSESEPEAQKKDEKTDEPDPETEPEPEKKESEVKDTPLPIGNGLQFTSNGDGTCRLSGIGSCTDSCIVIPETSPTGDLVTEIDAEALYGMPGVTAVQIPSTVQKIGKLAFARCKDLIYLSVSAKNRSYTDIDGVLYTKDGEELLQYPPMSAASEVRISSSVKKIAEMAFYSCPNLVRVIYSGTAEGWEMLSIGAKNYSLSAASKTFLFGE